MRMAPVPAVRGSLLLFAILLLTACITLIAPYDEKTDTMASALQRKLSEHFEALDGAQAPACFHSNYVGFYDDVRVDVSALDLRVRSFDLNAQTAAQTAELGSMVNKLEALHKIASRKNECLSSAEVSPVRRAFDSAFSAILKLELAKKRGKR